jgi:hypothetical protein
MTSGPRQGHLLAGEDDYHLLVLTVTDEIRAALAAASNKRLAEAAVPWSQTEEMRVRSSPQAPPLVFRLPPRALAEGTSC